MNNVSHLSDFIQANFKSASEFARVIGMDKNTIYRLKRKGVLVIGTKSSFTLYHPKQAYSIRSEPETDKNQLLIPDIY